MNHPFESRIMTVEELQAQGIAYNSSATELRVQGQQFKKHLSLRKIFRQVCLDYCQRELAQGRLCFVVEEDTALTIWQIEQVSHPVAHPVSKRTERATLSPGHEPSLITATPQTSQSQPQQRDAPANQLESIPDPARQPTPKQDSQNARYRRIYRGVPY